MVQGLAFLSKKSWHTKNISNQEKVWIAEQREQAEKQKTAELAKQILQEKEEDELAKIAGHTKQLDRGINWMYDGHHAHSETAQQDAAKQAEEYLLGKEYRGPAGKVVGDLDAAAVAHEGVNAVVSLDSKPAASSETWEELEHRRQNEAFRMRHEDPMFAVSLQAVRKEKDVQHRMELYERAGVSVQAVRKDAAVPANEKLTKEERRAQRRDKRKKEKKESKTKKSKKSRKSDEDSHVGRRPSRKRISRHHSSSRRRPQRRSRSRSGDRFSSESSSELSSYGSNHDEYSRNRHSRRHQYDNDRTSHDDRKRRRRENHRGSPPPMDNNHRDRDRSRVDNRKHPPATTDSYQYGDTKQPPHARSSDRYNDDRDRRRDQHQSSSNNDCQGEQKNQSGYGLQARARVGSSSNNSANADLGPDPKLLQRKREERDAERRRLQEEQSRRSYQTPAEREAARRELEQNASRWTRERRDNDPHSMYRNTELLQQDNNASSTTTTGNASFLHEMTQQVHGINQDQNLSERLRQNRNNQQRHNDRFL